MKVKQYKKFKAIYNVILDNGTKRIATKNMTPGLEVYGEELVTIANDEYRLWDPRRSKLAAAIVKGLNEVPIKPESKVLYLGAASGTTPSHISDIIGVNGYVFCIEFAPRSIRDLVLLSEKRENMIPLLADARLPRTYQRYVDNVDVVYCDVAQPDQAKIIIDNAKIFLKHQGSLLLAIKARSIDSSKNPSIVYKQQMNLLEDEGYTILEAIDLHPLEKDHAMIHGIFK
jgi:fibrillarin-like pre-rRNA processing protein